MKASQLARCKFLRLTITSLLCAREEGPFGVLTLISPGPLLGAGQAQLSGDGLVARAVPGLAHPSAKSRAWFQEYR